MLLGHYAAGLAAKKWAPKAPLGLLFGAAIWLDLIWPIFVGLGLEHFNISPGNMTMSSFDFTDYPLSHSLVMAFAWAAIWGLGALWLGKDSKTAWILAALVASHWFLDYLVHKPDLPLLPAAGMYAKKVGLSLWNYKLATLGLELGTLGVGLWLYLTSTKPTDKIGKILIWALVSFLVLLYWVSVQWTPSNSGPLMVLSGALVQLGLVVFGYWADDHRKEA